MQPVPATSKLLKRLSALGTPEAELNLRVLGRRAEAIVPECVGLSLDLLREELTLTLVPTADQQDGMRGPDIDGHGPAPTDRTSVAPPGAARGDLAANLASGAIAQARRLFSREGETPVASSLTLPLVADEEVVGRVTLYASTVTAFEGRHEMLAAALGASTVNALRDSDLSFSSRAAAYESWVRFEDQVDVDIALGMLAATYDDSIERAGDRLERAARIAGVSPPQAARVVRHLR